MVFGWSRRASVPQKRAVLAEALACEAPSGIASLAAVPGASDVSWAPHLASSTDRKAKIQQPFKLSGHDVKARLQDRSTAVVDLRTEVADAPADVMFDLLADPHQHERIFDAIESATAELVSEEGSIRRWRLDYRARWKFWKIGGVCENRLWMTTDREKGSVSFVLREPGFLRRYEGTWTITGPDGRGPGAARRTASGGISIASNVPSSPSAASASSSSIGGSRSIASFHIPFSGRSLATWSNSSHGSASSSGADSIESFGSSDAEKLGFGGGTSRGPSGYGDKVFGDSLSRGSSGGIVGLFAAINNPFIAVSQQQQGGGLVEPVTTGSQLRTPTTVIIRKAISPKVSPPFPVNQVLKGHATGQVSDMLEGLLLATARKLADSETEPASRMVRRLSN